MQPNKTPHHSTWHVVTVNSPVMWQRNEDETWLLNPKRRYILNSEHIGHLSQWIESISDLEGMDCYRKLQAGQNISNANILVERYRDRGIGDLLFMSGPLSYINHVCGGMAKIDMYALADRGAILTGHPALHLKTTLAGPLQLEDFQHYHYQWMVNTVTECNEEGDQLNVYDALYRMLGFDPASVPADFKRPSAVTTAEDSKALDQFFYFIWNEKQLDLRRTGYYVVAPLANSSLRGKPYNDWLALIKELSARRPVVVVGSLHQRLPQMGISVGEFSAQVGRVSNTVINALGATSLRQLMALINKATCVFSLDSACLYIAESFRVPAISYWGPHDPGVRIGYDKPYMDLAVWNHEACASSPCFAYSAFPAHKCPLGDRQVACECLCGIPLDSTVQRLDLVEKQHAVLEFKKQ